MYLPYSPRGVFATHERSGFTLVEVMLTMGIIGILASIVIGSLNVQKVFLDSYEQDRQHSVKQLESAMNQYIVETWGMASGTDIPTGSENARAICREGVSDISCVNVDILTPDYIPRIPQDPSETNPLFSGFLVYKSTGRPFIVAAHSGEMPGEGLPDTPGMTVFPTSGLTTTEAGGGASFTIVLSAAPTDDVMIGLSSSDTSEGTVSPASVTFTTADWSSAQNIIVTGVDDALIDGDISFAIVTAAASSSDSGYNGMNPSDVAVTNMDDDSIGITVNPISGLTTTEGGGSDTFTIVLDGAPTDNVIIGLSSSDTSEGTVSPASVTFTTGNWSTAQTITITGVDDAVADGNSMYTIVTAGAVSSDGNYNGLNPNDVLVSNTDDDAPVPSGSITVTPTSGLITTEAGGTDTFTIVLDSAPTDTVTINLSSSDTTEGTVSPASVTFTTGNWSTAQTITVTGVDDAVVDGAVAYSIITTAAVSSDFHYSDVDANDVAVSNSDNDVAGITVTPISGLITSEGKTSDTFTIVLNTKPTADVTIGLSSSDTSEGTVSPASVTFTTVNWNTVQTVTVTGVTDTIVDGDIAYSIITAAASSGDANYNAINANDIAVTNTDLNRFFPVADGIQPSAWELYAGGVSTGNTCASNVCFNAVNETSGTITTCSPSADAGASIVTNVTGSDITFDITTTALPPSATITDMNITVCARQSGGGQNAYLETIRCVSGSCTSFGNTTKASNSFSDISQNHSGLNITDLADIEIGFRRAVGAKQLEVGRILVDLIYTAP